LLEEEELLAAGSGHIPSKTPTKTSDIALLPFRSAFSE